MAGYARKQCGLYDLPLTCSLSIYIGVPPYMAARGLAPVHTPGLGSERGTGTIHLCHSANAPGKKGLEIPAHAPQAAHLRLTRTQEYVPSDAP
jgi:hypothetical protein